MMARLALGFATLACTLALAEGLLRALDFRFELKPEAVEFGWPNPDSRRALYEVDPDLFWVPKGYAARLETLRTQSPPELVFLGDSCTEFSDYPERFEERVSSHGGQISAPALGVGGWSSHQGLAQLRRDVLPLAPRAVSLYFGWNDHWMGFGVEDEALSPPGPLGALRIVQLLRRTRHALRVQEESPLRVSEPAFRRNLQQMARDSRAAGIVPVFLTAPSSHERGAEPEKLRERHIRDLDQLVPLHQRYVEIVREVAKQEDAVLCDLAARYEQLPAAERRGDFTSDGIHPNRSGAERVANLLYECFEAEPALRELLH